MSDRDPHGQASKAELAAIARQLRAILPSVVEAAGSPDQTRPPPVSRANAAMMLRFVAGFVVPGLLLIVLALVVGAAG